MQDCVPNPAGTKCAYCGQPWLDDPNGFHRNCPKSPDLQLAATHLGLTLDDTPGFHQQLSAWQAAGYPERTEAERAAIAATPCESRLETGVCNARGCVRNVKTVKCEWLARMATENCPGNPCLFGDKNAAWREEIEKAIAQ